LTGTRARSGLVWFQHFHKAAGTAVKEMAIAGGATLWQPNRNGNPLDAEGLALPLWSLPAQELRDFIGQCESRGVSFVATEWGVPDLDELARDSRVTLLTCLRDPLERFVSNFYFDLHLGYTPARSLEAYMGSRRRTITMDNYYCRMLARIDNRESPVHEEDYRVALARLALFDHVAVLERGLAPLASAMSWQGHERVSNRHSFSWRQALGLVRRGRLDLLALRLRYPKRPPDGAFVERFARDHLWDTRLYQEAIQLS